MSNHSKMGTSTMGSDLHSEKQDKLLKLQARKKELEQLLAAKNEELYNLCVQEVQFTGVMPPEAPLSPEVPQRERLNSVRSTDRSTDGNDVHDGSETSRRLRTISTDRPLESDPNMRKNLAHRLSTPSISGLSKTAYTRQVRRPETSCSNFFPSPPQDRNPDTFSIRTSHTFSGLPGLLEPTSNDNIHSDMNQPVYRHNTMTTEYMNKIYYNVAPEAQNVARLRETHFSSSHPDITHYTHNNAQQLPQPSNVRATPLLYQYASHLKAQNQHLAALHHHQMQQPHVKRRPEGVRRNTLQRTQTYHLTSHSEYNQHLENVVDAYRQPLPAYQHRSQPDIKEQLPERPTVPNTLPIREVPNTLPLRMRHSPRSHIHMPLQVSTDDYTNDRRCYPDTMSPVSQMSGISHGNFDSVSMSKFSPLSQDNKVKEKQWYETSLDSPTKPEVCLLAKSVNPNYSPGNNSQAYEVMVSTGRHSALQSPSQVPLNPPVLPVSTVPLESPKHVTVIEQGKCIPYREETKPFEMSDFYKYSTKFRQTQKPVNTGYNKLPMELPQYIPEQ